MSAENKSDIDKAANEILGQMPDVPGIWLATWCPQKGAHIAAYGKASTTPDVPATVQDHGRIGSVTKTVTAAAVLMQVEAGKLKLENTIAEILPDLAARHAVIAGITVDQLVGMRSGIPDYANTGILITKVVADPTKIWAPMEIVDFTLTALAKDVQLGTPGYSTTNYLILGEMLVKVTGTSVEEVLNNVACAVGLNKTVLTSMQDSTMPAPFSHGYLNPPGVQALLASTVPNAKPVGDVTAWSPSWGGAGGGMYSTVEELGGWAASGFGSTLLSKAMFDRRLETVDIKGVGHYGLGVIDFGDGWIGHTGQIIGWEAYSFFNIKTGATAAAIVNETGSGTAAVALIAKVFEDLGLKLLLGSKLALEFHPSNK